MFTFYFQFNNQNNHFKMSSYVTPPLKVSNNIILTPILCPNTSLLFLGHTHDNKKTYKNIHGIHYVFIFLLCIHSNHIHNGFIHNNPKLETNWRIDFLKL